MFVNVFIRVSFTTLLLLVTIFNNCKLLNATELLHVYCKKSLIFVKLPLISDDSGLFHNTIYWENLHSNSAKECQPVYHAHEIIWRIFLVDFRKCGFVRSVDWWQFYISYHQNLIVKRNLNTSKLNIKCSYKFKKLSNKLQQKRIKRDALPEDFQEDDDLEILDTVEQRAPEPQIFMEVRQNDETVDGMVTVIPGTPLVMEIKLNQMANRIYGLNVKYLEVSDTAEMSETILFRGCTVDSYLFENFNLTKTNSLISKFRAFKFPTTAFVQFRANVQICLNQCNRPQCTGDTSTESRKRREATDHKENVYEVYSSFVIKLNESFHGNEVQFTKLQQHVKQLHKNNLHFSIGNKNSHSHRSRIH